MSLLLCHSFSSGPNNNNNNKLKTIQECWLFYIHMYIYVHCTDFQKNKWLRFRTPLMCDYKDWWGQVIPRTHKSTTPVNTLCLFVCYFPHSLDTSQSHLQYTNKSSAGTLALWSAGLWWKCPKFRMHACLAKPTSLAYLVGDEQTVLQTQSRKSSPDCWCTNSWLALTSLEPLECNASP